MVTWLMPRLVKTVNYTDLKNTCNVAILRRLSRDPSIKFISEIEMCVGKCSSGRRGWGSSRKNALSKSHASYTLMTGATSDPESKISRSSFCRARDPGLRKTPSLWISFRIVLINGFIRFEKRDKKTNETKTDQILHFYKNSNHNQLMKFNNRSWILASW